ncbi:MAG: prephenate dehydratase [Solirubrobacteraceae bacterium]|nr:prephenate dehydratase [Solirubrobacteraceae bacterium]
MSAPVIGFLGPFGTFSQVAAQRLTAGIADAELVPVESIINLIQDLAIGEPVAGTATLDAIVVPIENSTEGSVGATLDTLVEHPGLVITAELDLPIEQLLVAARPIALGEIEQVYSHPQGIAQARRFLAEHVRQAAVVPVSSTSKGITLVAATEQPWAAIGSRAAAELNGCVILRDDIQEQVNVTRFVLIERHDDPLAATTANGNGSGRQRRAGDAGGDRPIKTTVVWQGVGDGSPGWLVRCLSEFAFRGLNLTKIESRPMRGQLGHYRFFVDIEGAAGTEAVDGAIEGLRNQCDEVRVLGSYPVAAGTA